MLTVAAFLLALGILIAVHEYGHYRVAVACGVKVLRFSIGFGKVLYRYQPKDSPTEFVIAAFPLGGYVKMLDEREAPVAPSERHLAFNTQPLRSRAAIVAAGPIANLLLAVVLYAVVNWTGMDYPVAVLASPTSGSIAEKSGLLGGEKVVRMGFEGAELQEVESFEDVRWFLTQGALEQQNLRLIVQPSGRGTEREVVLNLSQIDASEVNTELFVKMGIVGPLTRPVIGKVMPGAAADKAGLHEGDVVRQVGSVAVVDGQQLRQLIRTSVLKDSGVPALWKITRAGVELKVYVRPQAQREGELLVGKIGAYVGAMPDMVLVRYGVFEGVWRGVVRTGEISLMTLRTMGKMVLGEVSLKNLSGPLTVADYAGQSANVGLTQYLLFMALISVSLGVLNLLPIPVLDGGHLMYYLWEGVVGRPVSDRWMERLQRGGTAILLLMMSIALFNDITRLVG